MRKTWFFRWHWANPVFGFRTWWQFRRHAWMRLFWMRLCTWPRSNPICYCPTGSISELRIELLGSIFWLQLERDWTVRPCWCDKVIDSWEAEQDA